MDWRFIGSSFTPSLDAQGSHVLPTAQPFGFTFTDENRKPPKYSRWQYIVGVPRDEQQQVLEKLEEVVNSNRRRPRKPVMALQDLEENDRRYFLDVEESLGETDVMKERIKSYKMLSLSPYDTPSVDAWLKYTKAKASELIAKIQNNQHDIPEWMMPRLDDAEEKEVTNQNCELLHKMSSTFNQAKEIVWRGKTATTGLAYMFTIMLFFKKLLMPEFDGMLDAVKWMKTWSNDYIRINELRYNIPVGVHQVVSMEPVYWNYICSVMVQAKMAHSRFVKVVSYFFKHLKEKLEAATDYRDKIQKSIVVIFSESLIPRLFAAGYDNLAINLLRNWLGYNFFNDNSCNNFGHLGKHYVLNDMASLEREPLKNKSVFMELCDSVDGMLSAVEDPADVEVDLCRIKAMELEDLPIGALKLDAENRKELLFRSLELFGSDSINRLGSNTRWYNYAKGFVIKTKASKRFLTLMMMHSSIAVPEAKMLPSLLMRLCKSNDISKKMLQLHMDDPDLWATYAMLETDPKSAKTVFNEALNVFPNHVPLIINSFMHHVESSPNNLVKEIDALKEAVDVPQEEEATENRKIYEADLANVRASRSCAAAMLWTLMQKDHLNETRCRSKWNDYVSELNEHEAHLLLKVVCKCLPAKASQKLAEYIVKLYGNNEDIIATYVEYAITRANKNMIKQIFTNETTQPQLSIATRHLDCFTRYTEKSLFDFSSTRIMLLCRVDDIGDAMRTILEDPMPFKIPNIRALHYILDKFSAKYDPVDLITKNCPFAKSLWLKVIEHLPASSEAMKEEMESYGINV